MIESKQIRLESHFSRMDLYLDSKLIIFKHLYKRLLVKNYDILKTRNFHKIKNENIHLKICFTQRNKKTRTQ